MPAFDIHDDGQHSSQPEREFHIQNDASIGVIAMVIPASVPVKALARKVEKKLPSQCRNV